MVTFFQRAEIRLVGLFYFFSWSYFWSVLLSDRYNLKISALMWVFWENHHFLTGKEFSLTWSLSNFCPSHVYHPHSGFHSLMPSLIYLVCVQPEHSLLGGLTFWISWIMDIFRASIVKNLHLDHSYSSEHMFVLSESNCPLFSQHLPIIQLFTSYYSYGVQWLRAEGLPFCSYYFSLLLMHSGSLSAPSPFFHRILRANIQKESLTSSF